MDRFSLLSAMLTAVSIIFGIIVAYLFATHDDVEHIIRGIGAGWALFLFVGAKPATDWLPESIARDDKGFVLTGSAAESSGRWPGTDAPCELETTMPGVFACGDVRTGTTKRCAFAVGDGALAVTCVHQFLARASLARDA